MTNPVYVPSETPSTPPVPQSLSPQQERERKMRIAFTQGTSMLKIIAAGLSKIGREIMMMILKR